MEPTGNIARDCITALERLEAAEEQSPSRPAWLPTSPSMPARSPT